MATAIAPVSGLDFDESRIRQLTAFCTDGDWPEATLALWDSLRPFVAALTGKDPDSDVGSDLVDEACGGVLNFLIRDTLPWAAAS